MPNQHDTVEQRLEKISVEKLSAEERELLWNAVKEAHAKTPRAVPSPYWSGWFMGTTIKSYSMMTAAIALIIALSAGATVVAADDSRPGDALFAVDRAAENVRVAFASDDKKDELRVRFANERAEEVESIIDEESGRTRLAMEVRAKSSGDAAPEAALMAVSSEDDSTETADDSDGRNDSDDDSKDSEERIVNGLSVAIGYLSDVSAELEAKGNTQAKESVDAVITRLNSKISEIPEGLRTRLELDNNSGDINPRFRVRSEEEVGGDSSGEFELRGDGVKTRVEFKNGEIKIESEADDNSDDNDDDSSSLLLEIEADVFTDKTVVKVEHNDVKELFVTTAKTRAEVVAAIAAKFGLTEAEVDAVLDFEVENRASQNEDMFLSGGSGSSSDTPEDSNDDSSEGSGNGSIGEKGGLLGGFLGNSDDDDDSDDDSDDDDDDDDDDDSGNGSGNDEDDD